MIEEDFQKVSSKQRDKHELHMMKNKNTKTKQFNALECSRIGGGALRSLATKF